MPSPKTPLENLIALPTPRVWSVLVTIFGDLAQTEGETVSGPTLTRLTDAMGIKPEAVRVALHRLRNDDWITSVKSGRTALHALTEHGLRESQRASRLIYEPTEALPKGWQVALTQNNDAGLKSRLSDSGFHQIQPRMFIAHDEVRTPRDCVILQGKEAPVWFGPQIISADLTQQFADLLTVLRSVADGLAASQDLDIVDKVLTRCLVVHHWRRLVLRAPYLPPSVTGDDWPGHLCRAEVARILQLLPRPPLSAL